MLSQLIVRRSKRLQYYDEYGRTNGVLLDENVSKIYIPTIPERLGVTAASLTDAGSVKLRINISSLAPSWVKYFKIVYSRANTADEAIQTVAIDATAYSADITRLRITGIADWNDVSGATGAYVWEKGDRVRILSYDQGGTPQTDWADRLYEAEIIRENSDFIGSDGFKSIDFFDIGLSTAQLTGATIEIVRPSKDFGSDDVIYTEIDVDGATFFTNDVYIHRVGTTFQPWNGSIDIDIEGDAYNLLRTDYPTESGGTEDLIMESYSLTDFRDSVVYDKGRPTAVINREEIEAPSTIVYTEALIPNTEINNLNRVYPDVNFEEYDRNFGAINFLHNEMNHLLMFQEDKVSKVMIGQNMMYDALGRGNNISSNEVVLSKAIPFPNEYGMDSPFSFAKYAGRLFWIDLKRGTVLRMSSKGIEEISINGMSGEFFEKSNAEIATGNNRTYGLYNPRNHEYVLTIGASDTYVFSEKRNGWSTKLDYAIFKGCHLNNTAYFVDGTSGYKFHMMYNSVSGKYNKLGATELDDPFIQFVSNKEPHILKNYYGIQIDASNEMACEIETESTHPDPNQVSEIDEWRRYENEFRAAFLRNINTPNSPNLSVQWEDNTAWDWNITTKIMTGLGQSDDPVPEVTFEPISGNSYTISCNVTTYTGNLCYFLQDGGDIGEIDDTGIFSFTFISDGTSVQLRDDGVDGNDNVIEDILITEDVYPLLNGDSMKGKHALIKLTFDPDNADSLMDLRLASITISR